MRLEEKLSTRRNPEEFKQSINATHMDNDIEPYVCLSEDCISPMLFFVHMKDWISHMVAFHSDKWYRKIHMSTWYCDVGHEAELQFNDHESFVRHMKDPANHKDRDPPTDLQLDTLSRNRQRILVRDEEYCCPICECVPNSLEPVIASSEPDQIRRFLYEHIAVHIKDLAFKPIPTLDEAEPSEYRQSEVDDRSHGRLRGGDSTASHPSGLNELRQETSLAFEDRGSADMILDTDLASNWRAPPFSEYWEEYWEQREHKATLDLERSDPILDHFAQTQRQPDRSL